jgi:hypothetical protein
MQIRDEPLVLSHLRNVLRERKGEKKKNKKCVGDIPIYSSKGLLVFRGTDAPAMYK